MHAALLFIGFFSEFFCHKNGFIASLSAHTRAKNFTKQIDQHISKQFLN